MKFTGNIDKQTIKMIDKFMMRNLNASEGDTVIFTGSIPEILIGGTNFIKIHQIGSVK